MFECAEAQDSMLVTIRGLNELIFLQPLPNAAFIEQFDFWSGDLPLRGLFFYEHFFKDCPLFKITMPLGLN